MEREEEEKDEDRDGRERGPRRILSAVASAFTGYSLSWLCPEISFHRYRADKLGSSTPKIYCARAA